ncbi:MAG: hypothetical protein KDB33_00875, partial [Acidimicrobiales bacterium]|nr:hypothetical protein [Acidimicrobiales bacterium]
MPVPRMTPNTTGDTSEASMPDCSRVPENWAAVAAATMPRGSIQAIMPRSRQGTFEPSRDASA